MKNKLFKTSEPDGTAEQRMQDEALSNLKALETPQSQMEQPVGFIQDLNEEGTHSWSRLASRKWMFNNAVEIFYPGLSINPIVAPVKKAQAIKIIEIAEYAGQVNRDDPRSVWEPVLEKLGLLDDLQDEQLKVIETIGESSALVAKHEQGMRKRYRPTEDILSPPRMKESPNVYTDEEVSAWVSD